MPMNLDSVGAVSRPEPHVVDVEGRAALRARRRRGPDRPHRVRARVHDRELHRRRAARAADDAGRDLDGRRSGPAELGRVRLPHAVARRAGRDGARSDPARRRGRVGRAHRRHLRQGQGRDRAAREQVRRTSTAASPRSTRASPRSSAARVASASHAATRSPTRRRCPTARPTTRSRTRRAPTRRCSTA